MGKVNLFIKYCLRNEKKEYNIKGIYQNNIIKYKDFDTMTIINLNSNILERINSNQEIKLDFNNKKCFIKSNNINIDFDIIVIELVSEINIFYVKYEINKEKYEFNLKVL